MQARVKLFGHPIHQMLIVFPLGLLGMAAIFDIVALAAGNGYWSEIAYWMIIAGIISGLIAAPFGFLDWLKIPKRTRARRIGALHGSGNVIVLVLFAISASLRAGDPPSPPAIAYVLSFAAFAIALVTGWLGGELVGRLGIGVYEDAGVNAGGTAAKAR